MEIAVTPVTRVRGKKAGARPVGNIHSPNDAPAMAAIGAV